MKCRAIVLAIVIISFWGCTDSPTSPITTHNNFKNYKKALLIGVESLGGIFTYLEGNNLYQNYKPQSQLMLAELFKVKYSDLYSLSLGDIIKKYGEPWQINEIKNAAGNAYDTIVVFSDTNLTINNIKSSLGTLSKDSFAIDAIFCTHGNTGYMVFNDANYLYGQFAQFINTADINIRVFYHTSCYSKSGFYEWNKTKIQGINGADFENTIAVFSPAFFIKNWVNGDTYKDAVEKAFNQEIKEYYKYDKYLPVTTFLITDNIKSQSKQFVTGKNVNIKFAD